MQSRGNQPPEPEWLAKPSGDCCLKGHLHTGNPKGQIERITDVDTYIIHPDPSKDNGHIILYYPDVFGLFTNGLLVCDELASYGYTVAAIDYFDGDPIYMHREGVKTPSKDFDFDVWKEKYHKFAEAHIPAWYSAIKEKLAKPETKFACVGYCFGAPYVCWSLSTKEGDTPYCTVGAFAHPAFLKEYHFENLERPLMLSCAETDGSFETPQRNRALEILREGKKPYHLQLFSGVEHGFALRCNLEVPYERWCKEQSAKGMAEYFDFYLDVKKE